MRNRLRRLTGQFQRLDIHAYLITNPPDVRYISGFTGSSGACLIKNNNERYFITDFRYQEQAQSEVHGWNQIVHPLSILQCIQEKKLLARHEIVGIDREHTSLELFEKLSAFHPKKYIRLLQSPVAQLRIVKDDTEIETLQHACAILDDVFDEILKVLKPGIHEFDVAAELSFRCKRHGASKDAFDCIVASGLRSAMPHGIASAKTLEFGDLVIIDFGCVYKGYNADITRTIALGGTTRQQRDIYSSVLEAQEAAVQSAKSGMKAATLDGIARRLIKERGYAEFFGHSLGHGLGLEVHEAPKISAVNSAKLKKGMVCTIEPGIYIPGVGGVRIEDDVVIQKDNCTRLTHAVKDLIVI